MNRHPALALLILFGLSLSLALAGLYTGLYPLRLIASLLLVGLAPGYGLLSLIPIPSSSLTWLFRGFVALAASYAISVVGLMGLTYLVGTITPTGILIASVFLLGLLAGMAWRGFRVPEGEEFEESPSTFFIVGLLLLIAVAAFLRIWGGQYSDLQGDEAEVLIRAAKLIVGTENSLVTHSKGPAEILIVAALGALTGRLDEFTVRLPFALASVGGVAGVALLGRRLFGSLAGLVAGGLLAINGVFVTYARTAQYQSLMFLFSVWAAWFFFAYYRRGKSCSLLLGAFFLSAAFLTHFEAILLAPLPVFLVWRRLALDGIHWRQQWPTLAGAAGIMGVIVAAFYLPAVLNPQLRETGSYLAQRVGSAFPYDNFPLLYVSTLTYNSFYYLLLSAGLIGVALLLMFKRVWQWSEGLFAFVLLVALGLAVVWGQFLPFLQTAYLLSLSLIGVVILIFSARLPETVRGFVVWGAPAWLVYLFLVARPGNHYYVFFPPAVLVAGWGVAEAGRWLAASNRSVGQVLARGTLGAVLLAGLVMCAYYEYLLVVRNDLEYLLTYPENRRPFFVTDARFPFGSRIAFGFPYRLGWQMVAHLYRTGELTGDWGGNDKGNTPDWYTPGVSRTDCYPRNVMLGEITYKEDYPPLPFDLEGSGYRLRYRIWDNKHLRMQVYTLDPLKELGAPQDLVEPSWYPTHVTIEILKSSLLTPDQQDVALVTPSVPFSLSAEAKARLASVFDPRLTQVRDRLELVGYQLDETWSQPGGVALVTLYWRAVESVHLPFKVFVHLTGGPVTVQGDDFPQCGTLPMPRWQVGQLIADRHLLRLPADMPSGSYQLEVGIYEAQTGLRMDKLDVAGNPAGNSLHLADVAVRRSE
jgi:4-amino-4-deoxy-L-arabinose transferase-like glycosyltransferase